MKIGCVVFFIVLLAIHDATSFYVPGVAPVEFAKDESVEIKVTKSGKQMLKILCL